MTEPIKLPPLPEARIVSYQTDGAMRSMELRTYSDEDMRDYARAAIEADRQARGELRCMGTNCTAPGDDHSPECILEAAESQGWEDSPEADAARLAIQQRDKPKYFTYMINGHHRGISETEPPEDSYDDGTLEALYTKPQPAVPSRSELDAVAACHAVRPYIDSIVCYASTMDEYDGNRVAKMVEDVCAAHPHPAEPCVSSVSDKTVCGEQNAIHAPQKQYFYKDNNCTADNAESPDCICWHDEGCGPLSIEEQKAAGITWRDKPQPQQQASGEPVAWMKTLPAATYFRTHEAKTYFTQNPDHDGLSNEGWQPLYTAPQPQQQASEPLFWYRPFADGMYEGPVHNNSVGGKMLRDEKPSEWKPLYGAPQSRQIPEGYKLCLIPKEGTPAFNAACSVAYQESLSGTGPCGVFIAGLRAMLEAAPEAKENS